MATIVLFNGIFCREEAVINELLATTELQVVDHNKMVSDTARLSGMTDAKIVKAFSSKTSVFNKFSMEKERAVAYMRLALADRLVTENLLIHGPAGLLVPKTVLHALRVCLIAETQYRIRSARELGHTEREAVRLIQKRDGDNIAWTRTVTDGDDPWDQSLYDVVIPMDKRSPEEAADMIIQNIARSALQPTARSRKAVTDFLLAARVETALFSEGHHVHVTAEDGTVTLEINRHVMMLKRLEEELKTIANKIEGVNKVITQVGTGFHKSHIYRKHDFKAPSKVLLVDDEREFAETLSERLLIRDVGAAVVHDGQTALTVIENDDPEVVVIDLKMPDIDGMDILKKVKANRPEIEVIVLTGHGSGADKETCITLGAFAYMQKPVEIETLNQLIQEAYEKIQASKKE